MRTDTALRAAADMCRVRFVACLRDRVSTRRRLGSASSGNVRSIATISARRRWSVTSAPVRASSRSRCPLTLAVFGIGLNPVRLATAVLTEQRCTRNIHVTSHPLHVAEPADSIRRDRRRTRSRSRDVIRWASGALRNLRTILGRGPVALTFRAKEDHFAITPVDDDGHEDPDEFDLHRCGFEGGAERSAV